MAIGASLGKAYVEVLASLDKFPADLRAKLDAAVREATVGMQFQSLDKAVEAAGANAATDMANEFDRTAEPRFREAGRRSGISFWSGFRSSFGLIATLFLPTLIALAVEAVAALGPAVLALTATIPGALMALVAIGGAALLAFHGLGTAIGAAFTGDPAKLAKAIKGLAPAAQDFVKQLAGAHDGLHQLQQDVQQTFFVQLDGSLRRLLRSTLPLVHDGLVGIAVDLGQITRGVLDTLAANGAGIKSIFQAIHTSLAPLIPGIAHFLAAMITLSAVAGPFVAKLSQGFAQALEHLDQLINAAARNGELAQFFTDALVALHQFGAFLGVVWGLLNTIISALATSGAAAFGVVGQLLSVIDAFLRTAAGQQTLAAIFNLLNTALLVLSAVLTPLLPTVGLLAGILSDRLITALTALAPALAQLADDFGRLLLAVGTPLLDALTGLVLLLAPILDFLTRSPALFDTLVAGLVAWKIATAAMTAAQWLFDAALDANPIGLFIIAIALMAAEIAGMVYVIKTLIDHWAQVKAEAAAIWGIIWGKIKEVAAPIGHWLTVTLPGWVENMVAAMEVRLMALPGIAKHWLMAMVDKMLETLGMGVGLLIGGLLRLPQELEIVGKAVFDWLAHVPAMIGSAFASLAGLIGGIFFHAMHVGTAMLSAGWDEAMAFLRSIPGRLLALGPALLSAAGSLAGKIGDGLARIGDFASDIGGKIVTAIKAGLNHIIDGINSGIDKIAKFIPGPALPHLPHFASGGIIDRPTLGALGEGGKREVVLPLTNPARTQQLAQDSGLLSMLRGNQAPPNVSVYVTLGTGEILSVIDSRVDMGLDEQAMSLAHGQRS